MVSLRQINRRTVLVSLVVLWANSAFTSLATGLSEVTNIGSQQSSLTIPLTRKKVPVKRQGVTVSHKTTYSGLMNVGLPRQQFRVVFDTGSGHVVLPGTECDSHACTIHRRYSQSDSPKAVEINIDKTPTVIGEPYDEVTVNYGTGNIVGTFVNESVCLGEAEAETCVNMGFIKASQLSHNPFAYFPVDGIFGLGLTSLALNPDFNFFNVFSKERHFQLAQFSMYIGDGDEESELVVGGYNPQHLASPLKWSPVAMPEMGHWQIGLKAIYIGGKETDLCKEGDCRAIFDTGTSHLGVPTFTEKLIEDALSIPANGMKDCLKADGVQISFEFAGFNLTLGPDNYMRRMPLSDAILNGVNASNTTFQSNLMTGAVDSTASNSADDDIWCRPLLMPVTLPKPLGPNLFILGEPLLRRYYTVFDWQTPALGFGLAAKKHEVMEDDPLIFMQQSVKKGEGVLLVQVTIIAKRKTKLPEGLMLDAY